jgi:hypothetical protein
METKLSGIATPFGPLTCSLRVNADGSSAAFEVGPLADRPNDPVGCESSQFRFVKYWCESPGIVEHSDAALKDNRSHAPRVVQQDLLRTKAVMSDDALLFAFNDLGVVGRQLIETLQGTQVNCADTGPPQRCSRDIDTGLADHGAGHIVGHVSAADDHDLTFQIYLLAQRHVAQEFHSSKNTYAVGTGNR